MLTSVITTNKDSTFADAVEILYKKHIGSLIIVDDAGRCLGIFTERDAIKCVAENVSLDTPMEKIMTKKVVTVDEDASFDEVKMIINTHKIRHLPVVNKDEVLVGLFSVREVLDEFFGFEKHQHI